MDKSERIANKIVEAVNGILSPTMMKALTGRKRL